MDVRYCLQATRYEIVDLGYGGSNKSIIHFAAYRIGPGSELLVMEDQSTQSQLVGHLKRFSILSGDITTSANRG